MALSAHRLLGVPAEELRRVGDLAARVGERLAVLPDDQPREVVGTLGHELEGAPQHLGTLPGRRRRPGGERGRRGAHRRKPILDRCVGDRRDHLAGGGIVNVEGLAVGGVHPAPVDHQLRRCADRLGIQHGGHDCIALSMVLTMRSTDGIAMSSSASADGSGMCGVVMRSGGPSR